LPVTETTLAELLKPAELAHSLAVHVERIRVCSPHPVDALLEVVAEREPAVLVFGPDRACLRRRTYERAAKRIDGSVSIPAQQLSEQIEQLPRDKPILVYCAGGYRSSLAASLMQRAGITQVSEIAGGLAAWEAAQLPIAS